MTYCSTLKDFQVVNVYKAEKERMRGLDESSEVYQAAKELRQEAKEEAIRRGIEDQLYE
jgi:hypothetical protein